jgi:hypothetical protein
MFGKVLDFLAAAGGTAPALQSDRGGRTMALANLLGYVVVFGLPIWLVAEEIAHRLAMGRQADVFATAQTTAATPAGLERRAAEGVRAHASYV